ncbi:hypothetical protein ACNQGB_13910 [Flavobacterium sp. XS1P32]
MNYKICYESFHYRWLINYYGNGKNTIHPQLDFVDQVKTAFRL